MKDQFEKFIEEEEQEAFDDYIKTFGDELLAEEMKDAMVNPSKVGLVLYFYKTLKSAVKGTGVKVSYKMYEPIRSMGYVIVTGKNISFKDQKAFFEVVKLCDNFDVCPKTDGTVEMNFTVHDLTISIDKKQEEC